MEKKTSDFSLGRILIVDDEQELMTVLCEKLAEKGYETAGFTSGEKALDTLKNQDFDILLTDLVMPGMDGIALLKAALEIDHNIINILMTGQGTVQTAVKAIQSGAFDYILKPFKINFLLPLVYRAMEMRRLKLNNIQLQETVAVHELATMIAFPFDTRTILNKLLDAALQQCQGDEASIMLPEEDGKSELYIAVARGKHLEQLMGTRVPVEGGIAGWVARNHQLVTLDGKVEDARFKPVNPRDDIHSAASMPILAGGKLLGVLNVSTTQSRRAFTLGQIKGLSILVSIVAPVLENSWLYDQIRQAEEKYRSIFNNTIEGIFQSSPEGRFITANFAMASIYGFASPEKLITGITDISKQLYINPEDRERYRAILEEKGVVNDFEAQVYRKDGNTIWTSTNTRAVKDAAGNVCYFEGTAEDITDRKRAEETLKESEEKYRSIFENAVEGIYQSTPEGQFLSVNPAMARIYGYESPEEMITSITNIGKQLYVDPQEKKRHENLLEEYGIVDNFEAQLYRKDGIIIWVSLSTRAVKDATGKVLYNEGIVEDITSRKLAEEELKKTLEKLKKSLAGTIQAMSLTVEIRDPYTAGHQRKVSNLARTIAQEMGLSSDTIDIIRMAGIIHDIGKISVPAEILVKPGKISDIEMGLIKVHPQSGYDILKDVELPYPIAEIVLQHHERLDGSGYPQGLKGEQILLESQIISVADVVEAISSHRPYRPGFGIDVALEDIEKNKGILYDEKVVEVCLKLFREKGFSFE